MQLDINTKAFTPKDKAQSEEIIKSFMIDYSEYEIKETLLEVYRFAMDHEMLDCCSRVERGNMIYDLQRICSFFSAVYTSYKNK